MFRKSVLIVTSLILGIAAFAEEQEQPTFMSAGDILATVFKGGVSEQGGQLVSFSEFNSCATGKYIISIDFNDRGKVSAKFAPDFKEETYNGNIANGVKAGDPLYIQMFAAMAFVQDAAKHLTSGGKIRNEKAQARAEQMCDPAQFEGLKAYAQGLLAKQVPQKPE